jgi:glycerol-3-phosphate acyltransferase PlsX
MMKIALDVMGGDHGPAPAIEGALQAAQECDVEVLLVGDEATLTAECRRLGVTDRRLSIRHASQVVEMHESPATVARKKRDSSIWVATELVKSGEASAVVSPGNTGASMVASFFLLGLTKGVERPAIATSLPTLTGTAIMLDVGANVDCTAQHLAQFAIMGNEYGKYLFGKPNPRVGLLSIGEEDGKGNEVTKEAFKLLKASPINFIGNIEGRDVYSGSADVVVCDGFIGNVALKISEGVADTILLRPFGLPAHCQAAVELKEANRLRGIRRSAAFGCERHYDDLPWPFVCQGDQECHSSSEGAGRESSR